MKTNMQQDVTAISTLQNAKEIREIKKDIAQIKAVLAVIAPHVEKLIEAENSLFDHYMGK